MPEFTNSVIEGIVHDIFQYFPVCHKAFCTRILFHRATCITNMLITVLNVTCAARYSPMVPGHMICCIGFSILALENEGI